jgi:hypothetical protein
MSGQQGNTAAELAVHAAAGVHHANAARLCDSDSFMTAVEQMHPDKPGFVARVSDAIREAVNADASYRLPQAPPHQQAEQAPRQWTDEDIAKARPEETVAAMKAGLLTDLGVGAPRRKRGATL